MISLSYSCKCGWKSGILSDAQDHSNRTSHHVGVSGFLTPNVDPRAAAKEATAEESVKRRAFENAILRAARDKNLVGK